MAKLRVGLLFGGRSVEHEVSIASATSILGALDPTRFDVKLIAIDPEGRWHLGTRALPPEATIDATEVTLPAVPGSRALVPTTSDFDRFRAELEPAAQLDVLFPIVHGRGGEDGVVQGLLELAGVAYVGAGVLGSALQMDKEVAKRLLKAAGIPVVPWLAFQGAAIRSTGPTRAAEAVERELGLPVFVKPANSGSSVGISKASDVAEVAAAIEDAGRYDTKVIVEQSVDGREIEVGVIGNDDPQASVAGEIRNQHEFYDYEAKYVDESTELIIPADISDELSDELRRMAVEAFRVLEGAGLARVDFLVERGTDRIYVNELNSLPGFTDASMFPRLWEATGLPYPALLDRLIELALERNDHRARLETTYRPGAQK